MPTYSKRATFTAKRGKAVGASYRIPVWFFHKKTKKPVSISLDIDTGAYGSVLSPEIAAKAGLYNSDSDNCHKNSYAGLTFRECSHEIYIQIGNLEPVEIWVDVPDKPTDANVLGAGELLNYYRILMGDETVTFEEKDIPLTTTKGAKYETIKTSSKTNYPQHDILIYNPFNNKAVKIPVIIDTGANSTMLDTKYLRLLGINSNTKDKLESRKTQFGNPWEKGSRLTSSVAYKLKVQISPDLKPFKTWVWFTEHWDDGVLGAGALHDSGYYKISFEDDRIRYEETFYGTAGVSNSARNYRRRYI